MDQLLTPQEAAERLRRGAGPNTLVGVDDDRVALALRDRHRRDLVGEAPFLLGRGRALVTARCELVLHLAGDATDLADVVLGAAEQPQAASEKK